MTQVRDTPRAGRLVRYVSWWPLVADAAEDEGSLWMRWLVRLRWVAIAGQVVTLSFAFNVLSSPLLVLPLVAVIVGLALGNARALQILSHGEEVGEEALLAQLSIDVFALTAFFVLGGGPENPFTILYVIHVAMAAVMLRATLAAALTTIVLACYGLIHVAHLPLELHHHALGEHTLTIIGRVLSFAIASVSVAAFVVGLSTTLRRRSRQLLDARDRTAKTDRLRSVGTLAAGAAHELNTPLSTIGLRVRRVARRHEDADTTKDLEVVQDQLARCRRVVEQLLVGVGDPSASGMETTALGPLVAGAVKLWDKGAAIDAVVDDRSEGLVVELPRVAFTQALINLLENAREAQEDVGATDPIVVEVTAEVPPGAQTIPQPGEEAPPPAFRVGVVTVRDRGCGLPEQGSERVGDPFFTTKPTGTGLGVFVARAVAEGAGGGLDYATRDGGGTDARWWFPETRRSA